PLAASLACTPTESPWTLPSGLPGDDHPFFRPGSPSTSSVPASEIASLTASGSTPSASAAATVSAAFSCLSKQTAFATFSLQPSPTCFDPGWAASSLCAPTSLGCTLRTGGTPRWLGRGPHT